MLFSFINVFTRVVRLVTRASTRFYNKTVNLKLKLQQATYISFKKLIFQRVILSKTFCHFPNVRVRTNAFRKEVIADHKVEQYKNKLLDYWRCSQPDVTICRS